MESIEQILTSDNADLYRLNLDIPIPGYRDFIAPWLVRETGFSVVMGTGLYRTILVDPGPACGIPSLLGALERLDVRRIDYVLLTHVHIDHAGGIGGLASAYPRLKVVVHDRGRAHLVEPARLWEGSLQTLGQIAEAFGPILPLPEANLLAEGKGVEGIGIIDTPGHAPHHQSYVFGVGNKEVLFSGEAAGVHLRGDYLRPATPPKFSYDIFQASLERLLSANASLICYGHFGYSADPDRFLRAHREQLELWRSVADEVRGLAGPASAGSRLRRMAPVDSGPAVDACLARLLVEDSNLSLYREFDRKVRDRESFYLRNSIKGFLG